MIAQIYTMTNDPSILLHVITACLISFLIGYLLSGLILLPKKFWGKKK